MRFGENPESKYASNLIISSKTGRGAEQKAAELAKLLGSEGSDPFRQIRAEKLVCQLEFSSKMVRKKLVLRKQMFWNLVF